MISNASKGAYFKARTRKWLLAQGYQVADMEIVRWLFTPKGRIPVKRDQFGADLVAMSEYELVFIQVKGGAAARGNGTFPAARRVFDEFRFPIFVDCWIVAWAPRVSEPRIVDVRAVNLSERTGTHVQKEESRKVEGREAVQGQAEWQDENKRPRLSAAVPSAPRHGAAPQRQAR